MRIVIDMQGAQTGSRFRGIGRYVTALAKAMVRNRAGDEILLVLNGAFPNSVEHIREEFANLLPASAIRIWESPRPMVGTNPEDRQRHLIAEQIREAFIASLCPDVVLIGSLFEGYGSDAVISVGASRHTFPTAVILYDLFPLTHPERDHETPLFRNWYEQRLQYLKECDCFLAISEYSKLTGIDALKLDKDSVVTIYGACDAVFTRTEASVTASLPATLGISRPFLLYAGGADKRKNLHRLIESYASLPNNLARQHQLVIVGDMPQGHIDDFLETAKKSGLAHGDVIIPGYVDDPTLLNLYHQCKLFVFPSVLEGLGLPPLEAMSCGAPVIASNVASIPEVVGSSEALFDPTDCHSITTKMTEALTDERFRKRLIDYGYERVKVFSWDTVAQTALQALRRFPACQGTYSLSEKVVESRCVAFEQKKLKILLLKLDHIGDFILALPAIGKIKARYPYAKIDIAVGSWNTYLASNLGYFNKIHVYDFHKRATNEGDQTFSEPEGAFLSSLGDYDIAIDLRRQPDTRFLLQSIKAKLKIGYTTFNDVIDSSLNIVLPGYPDVPFHATRLNNTHISRQMVALVDAIPDDPQDYISFPQFDIEKAPLHSKGVAIFPEAGNSIKEWGSENFKELITKILTKVPDCTVNIFLSSKATKEYWNSFGEKVSLHIGLSMPDWMRELSRNKVCVANNSGGAHLAAYLGLTTIGIYGGSETVAEWHPPVGNISVLSRNAFCSPCHCHSLSPELEGGCPNNLFCLRDIPPDIVCAKVVNALTEDRSGSPTYMESIDDVVDSLLENISQFGDFSDHLLNETSHCIAQTFINSGFGKKRLFVDISELVRKDANTGIQRVVKNMLNRFWMILPHNWEMIPVYNQNGEATFKKASDFTKRYYGVDLGTDSEVVWRAGDVFFGLDTYIGNCAAYKSIMDKMKKDGVKRFFMVYDLLPIIFPHFFDSGLCAGFQDWLKMIAEVDGALCISKSTRDELQLWIEKNAPDKLPGYTLSYSHIGADFQQNYIREAISSSDEEFLKVIADCPSFLMVSTIEPRKGHAQVLSAFEQLWNKGVKANLLFVGKEGWMVEDLIASINRSPWLGKRLFWLNSVSDEYLTKLYTASTCLIAASKGEGFGLFLVEAAQHKLPIIARDIPVFREIAGDHAFYFHGDSPEAICGAVEQWLTLWNAGNHIRSDNMPWLSWEESAALAMRFLIDHA